MTDKDTGDRDERPWEKYLGVDVLERTSNVGASARLFREIGGLSYPDELHQKNWNRYISVTGAQMMQMRMSKQKEEEAAAVARRQKVLKLGHVLRNRVQVFETKDGNISIQLDRDWDTSDWSTEMLDAGLQCLLQIFFEKSVDGSEDATLRKEKATHMVEKLLSRHTAVRDIMKVTVESMVSSATTRSLRQGRSAGVLDLLYVINCCKSFFMRELSQFSYTAKAITMMTVELRLAAMLIQHSYRARLHRKRPRRYIPATEGFGSVQQIQRLRNWAIMVRSLELRYRWKIMHERLDPAVRKQVGGFRGPVYIGEEHSLLALQSVYFLTSEGLEYATSNREDVINANGCILLVGFLSATKGPFASLACQILAEVAKVPQCLYSMIHSGIARAVVKYLWKVQAELNTVLQTSANEKISRGGSAMSRQQLKKAEFEFKQKVKDIRDRYKTCMSIVTRVAIQAAGVFRARGGYRYKKKTTSDSEAIDYKITLRDSPKLAPEDVVKLLGDYKLVREVFGIVVRSKNIGNVKCAMEAAFALSCSECLSSVLKEIVGLGATALLRLIELLEESDAGINSHALAILLQVCTVEAGRDALMKVNIPKHICHFTKATYNYDRRPYQRAILICAALCRQEDWRAYDPVDFPLALSRDDDTLRQAIMIDLLRSIRCPDPNTAEDLSLVDLVVLGNKIPEAPLEFSKAAEAVAAREIADFLTHPNDERYFQSLPWDEAVAICCILEGLAAHKGTAMTLFSAGTIAFLGQAIYLSKFVILGPDMSDRRLMVVLNGVAAAANALSMLSLTGFDSEINANVFIEGAKKVDLVDACCFFINTLGVKAHPSLDTSMKELQLRVGQLVLDFFKRYASMLVNMDASDDNTDLKNLTPCGIACSALIKNCIETFGKNDIGYTILDNLCQFMASVTIPNALAGVAVRDWKIIEALRAHLPSPLAGIAGEGGVEGENYKLGIGFLPASFFQVLANICQNDRGKGYVLADGFLRRTIEKVTILFPYLEGKEELAKWTKLQKEKRPLPEPSTYRKEVITCLRVIARMCNYHTPQFGSANDCILTTNIIEICASILRIKECPRSDPAIKAALDVFAGLSRDVVRMAEPLERSDTLQLMKKQLEVAELTPEDAIISCIETIRNMATGTRSPYILKKIGDLRQPLMMVSRIYPRLVQFVRDCNWEMTVCLTSADRINRGSSRGGSGSLRTSSFASISGESRSSSSSTVSNPYSRLGSLPSSPMNASVGRQSASIMSSTESHTLHADDFEWGGHGTFEACGPTSCGSLRLPSSQYHGEYRDLDHSHQEMELLKLPVAEDGLMDVSKLSARDPELRERLEMRKANEGFTEKKKFNPYNDPRIRTPSSSLSMSMSQHQHQHQHTSLPPMFQSISAPNTPVSKGKKKTGSHGQSRPPQHSKSTTIITSPMKAIDTDQIPELLMTRPPPHFNLKKKHEIKQEGLFAV